MNASTYQLRADLAVIGILRRMRDAGAGLASLQQLHREWPRYGLRRSDLDRSVLRLESLGFLTVEQFEGLRWFGLTPRGDRWAHAFRIWVDRIVALPRTIGRWFAPKPPGESRRRLVDRLGGANGA